MTFRNEFLIDEDVYTVEILSLSDEIVMLVKRLGAGLVDKVEVQ